MIMTFIYQFLVFGLITIVIGLVLAISFNIYIKLYKKRLKEVLIKKDKNIINHILWILEGLRLEGKKDKKLEELEKILKKLKREGYFFTKLE